MSTPITCYDYKENSNTQNCHFSLFVSVFPFLSVSLGDRFRQGAYVQLLRVQVSISSTFYKHLLHAQTPKAQKKIVKSSSFFALSGSASVKAACRKLVKLIPDLRSRKKTVKSSIEKRFTDFALLGSVCVKAVHKHVDEIDPLYV